MEYLARLVDLDGVLVDSVATEVRSWGWLCERHGLDVGPFLRAGGPARDKLKRLAPHLDAEACAIELAAYQVADADDVTALPGAASMIEQGCVVVSSAAGAVLRARLDAAGLPLPALRVTADDIPPRCGKPHALPYRRAAAAVGVEPRLCIAFEDAPDGIVSARAAGVGSVVGVSATRPVASVRAADLIVSDLAVWLASEEARQRPHSAVRTESSHRTSGAAS